MVNQTEKELLEEFAKDQLKLDFGNLELLKESLTHKSYVNEVRPKVLPHNERLEFLGDAVLELVVTEHLYSKYPDRPEGELTSFRAALVKKESLASASTRLNYGKYIFMSRGEEATGGRERAYILANTYESVLGAIYLELGYEVSKAFIQRTLIPYLKEIVANRLDIDSKSKLQEIIQEIVKVTPSYELVSESGPDHDKKFIMGLMVDGRLVSKGEGKSKQDAEQDAASNALENWDKIYSNYFNFDTIQSTGK